MKLNLEDIKDLAGDADAWRKESRCNGDANLYIRDLVRAVNWLLKKNGEVKL